MHVAVEGESAQDLVAAAGGRGLLLQSNDKSCLFIVHSWMLSV